MNNKDNESYEYWVALKKQREEENEAQNREIYIFNNCLDKCPRFIHKCKGGINRCWKRQHFSDN